MQKGISLFSIMKTINNSIFYLTILLLTFSHINLKAQEEVVTLSNNQKIIIYPDKTWDYYKGVSYDFDFSTLKDNAIPSFLRQGIDVSKQTLITAVEMYYQGWRYTMPQPKSAQAYWGNGDGRTTWWKGYWYNNKTKTYSATTPTKQKNGNYYWR